jgi:hypothetical protein
VGTTAAQAGSHEFALVDHGQRYGLQHNGAQAEIVRRVILCSRQCSVREQMLTLLKWLRTWVIKRDLTTGDFEIEPLRRKQTKK